MQHLKFQFPAVSASLWLI